jgi:hypothetical protein
VARINGSRVLGGGLVAAIISFLTDGLLHERLLGADWRAVHDNLRIPETEHRALGIAHRIDASA